MHDPRSSQPLGEEPEQPPEASLAVAPDDEPKKTFRPLESWQVEDDEVRKCIPSSGLIAEYMEYCPTTCDGPLWFQLGGFLTVLSVIAAKCDFHAGAKNGLYEIGGLHLWSANVGYTGTRKSQCVRPALNILRNVSSTAVLATDFSIEALHDTLKDRDGIGLMHRDEMSTLFAQGRRSYSTGLPGWMLEAYNGGPTERLTKAGGSVLIPRVRLSVLGNIPPSTLQVNTSREDWRTGFLPRFNFWGARRTRYMDVAPSDTRVESYFTEHLKKYIFGRELQVIIPYELGKLITDWHSREVDDKGHTMPDELYSALLRLRTRGFQIASLYALSRVNYKIPSGKAVLVEEQDVLFALEILKLLRRSTSALFLYVGGSEEATQERRAVVHFATRDNGTVTSLAEELGLSVKTTSGVVQALVIEGSLLRVAMRVPGQRGRPAIRYIVPEQREQLKPNEVLL